MYMRRLLRFLIIIICAAVPAAALANYTVESVEGKVTVVRGDENTAAAAGMKLRANDKLNISPGAKIVIYNELTKELDTSTTAGHTDVTSLMFNARSQASSNNIISKASITPRSSGNTRQYTQGSVKRAMTAYDPEGASVNADPAQIALRIIRTLDGSIAAGNLPVAVQTDSVDNRRCGFTVTNPLNFPIYLNTLQLSRTQAGGVELSKLGQPTGCYVLLPGQTISRSQTEGLATDELHFLVIAHYQFDIDDVLAAIAGLRDKSIRTPEADDSLEVYIVPIN